MDTNKHSRLSAAGQPETGLGRLWRRYFRSQNDAISSFGTRLRLARKERGFSQSRLARWAGLMPATIADLESDRSEPMAEEIRALATALRLPASQLLDG